jgi:uncharacterized membrane protein YphA (DoxX/SURF4 family)
MNQGAQLRQTWLLLKLTYGLYYLIIGTDKFFGFFTESQHRVSFLTLSLIPLSLNQLLYVVGLLEIIVGLLILSRWTRIGAYAGFALLVVIVANIVAMGKHYDIALHGTAIASGMLALARLTAFINDR